MVAIVDLVWFFCFDEVIDALVRIRCWIIWILFVCCDGMKWLFFFVDLVAVLCWG